MTSRERLQATLNHTEPDRLCLDFGAGFQTGMGVGAVHRLRNALFGANGHRVKVVESYQMLGELDEELRQALKLDVVGVHGAGTMFGFKNEGWKPFTLFDGTPVLVPGQFNVTPADDGGWLIYPEGDTTASPCAWMPKDACFFDALNRQPPLDEARLDPGDNCEEMQVVSDEEVRYYAGLARHYHEGTTYGIYMTLPGTAFGDIALVPAPWMKRPKGIRGVQEWYMATVTPQYPEQRAHAEYPRHVPGRERQSGHVTLHFGVCPGRGGMASYLQVIFVSIGNGLFHRPLVPTIVNELVTI